MKLTIATLKKHISLDPACATSVIFPAISMLYQTLVRQTHLHAGFSADLASHWESSGDGKTWRFHFNQATFHDGSNVTGTHIATSFARLIWPSSESMFAEILRPLILGAKNCTEGEIPAGLQASENGILISLTNAYCPFLDLIAHPAMSICLVKNGASVCGSGPMQLSTQNFSDNCNINDSTSKGEFQPDNEADRLANTESINFEPFAGYTGSRKVAEKICLLSFDDFTQISAAFEHQLCDAALLERKHQLRLNPSSTLSSTVLPERWVGTVMLNGAGVFREKNMREDFHCMLQDLAKHEFGPAYSENLLPQAMLGNNTMPESDSNPDDFFMKWASTCAQQPIRILYAPGRGPLTQILDRLLQALNSHQIAHTIIRTNGPTQVYQLVAEGQFDIVVRGWLAEFEDADEYFGIFEKQAPEAIAQAPFIAFYTQQAKAKYLAQDQVRRAEYAKALLTLNQHYLCIPVCQDYNRVFHHPSIALNAMSRDIFDYPGLSD